MRIVFDKKILKISIKFNLFSKIFIPFLLTFLIILSYISTIPFNEAAKDFANEIRFFEYVFLICNILGTGSLIAWGLANIVLGNVVEKILSSSPQKNYKYFYISILLIISAASRIPNIYIAFLYTHALFWPLVVCIAQSGLPLFSLHKMIKDTKLFIKSRNNRYDSRIENLKSYKLNLFSREESEIQYLLRLINEKGTRELVDFVCKQSKNSQTQEITTKNYLYYSFQFMGFATAVGSFIFRGKLSYGFAGEFFTNSFGKTFFMLLCILPTAYISFDITYAGFRSFYKKISEKKPANSLLSSYNPRFMRLVKCIYSLIGILTFAGIATVCRNEFGFDSFFGIFVVLTASINTAILSGNAMSDLVDWVLKFLAKRFGNQKIMREIFVEEKLEGIISLLENSSEEFEDAVSVSV